MSSIMRLTESRVARIQKLAGPADGHPIRPATGPAAGIGGSFEAALRAVDAEQHQAGAAMAAVDSGKSDDLVGAMIDSQKASVSFSALLQVRNKLTTAFDDVMRMPL